MATRNADVNLIVRARTEGEKAVAGLGDILEALFDNARQGSDDLSTLGKTIGALDKAAAAIAGSMDKAGSALDRQRASIVENNAAYGALLRQQAEAQRVQQQMENFVGPRTPAQTSNYASVTAEVDRLAASISNLFGKITQQNAQLNGTQSALLNLSATSEAVAQGQAEAEARIELTTQALREQAEAAERVTDIQRRINDITGVNRPDATGSTARAADILAAADAEFRRLEAVRAEAEAQRVLNNQLAERASLEAAIERNTGTGRIRATDAGASFSALADREREAEVAERAAAQKEKEAAAERELVAAARATNNALAERAQIEAALERNTGLGRTRATDAGATISALTELVNKQHEAAAASEEMDREAVQLRATLDPLAAIQERFNNSLARFKVLAGAGKISADELAAAETHLAAEAQRARDALEGVSRNQSTGKVSLFGLKPYELQNLSYQINDVVTGLASGQHATQIIAQQGGQILQLFPRVAGSLIGALKDPRIAALVVVVAGLALGLKKAADEAARLREYTAQTTFRADAGSYDPKALSSAEEGLTRIGAKAADARTAVKLFLSEGVNPELLSQFARVAQETAEILGTDLPSAARQVADAFTGGFNAVAALDDKLGFLTASEREHIKQLFEEGNAQAARTEALNAYTRQADAAAAKQRGPWTDAARSLGNAWNALIKWIADSAPIRATITVLNGLAGAVKAVGDAITDALGDDAKPATGATAQAADIARVQAQINGLRKGIAEYEAAIAKGSPISGTLQRLVDRSKEQLAAAEANLARLERTAPDTVTDDPNGTAAKRRTERLSDIDQEQQLQALRQRGQAGLNAADGRRRAQLAGELAYRQEMASTGDAIVAARLREIAVTREQGEIDRQNEAARKNARQEREREIQQFQRRVVGAEGGTAQNPYSTAKGYGQFTQGTWMAQFAKVFPEQSRSLGREQILALRNNEQVARAIIDNYARENARFLESFGAKVTAGNLYLSHFLGGAGAKAVLTAPGDRPVDQIIRRLPDAARVLSGNQGYLRTNGGRGRYRTADELEQFIANRVGGDTGAPQSQGQEAITDLIEDSRRKQEAFNDAVRHGNEDRQRTIDALRAEAGLQGTALLAEQRRQAVLAAELDLRQRVEDANKNLKPGETPVVLSQEQVNTAKDLAAALFDAQHASEALNARLADAQRPLDTMERQRDLLVQQRDLLLSMGEFDEVATVQSQIDALGGSIADAYDKLIEFYKALSPEDRVRLGIFDTAQLDILIKKLEQAKAAAVTMNGALLGGTISYRNFLDAFASSAADAFTSFIQNVAQGQNVFKSFGKAILQFAASFASALAQMILKALAFAAALYVLSAITGIPVQVLAAGAAVGASVHHAGGIAGSAGGVRRNVNPAIFQAAMRYHTGGIAGLAPDEVPAILKRGEEVLTEGDPRHRANGSGGSGGSQRAGNVTVIQVSDPAQALEQALRTPAGEKVFINHVRENQGAFKAALG